MKTEAGFQDNLHKPLNNTNNNINNTNNKNNNNTNNTINNNTNSNINISASKNYTNYSYKKSFITSMREKKASESASAFTNVNSNQAMQSNEGGVTNITNNNNNNRNNNIANTNDFNTKSDNNNNNNYNENNIGNNKNNGDSEITKVKHIPSALKSISQQPLLPTVYSSLSSPLIFSSSSSSSLQVPLTSLSLPPSSSTILKKRRAIEPLKNTFIEINVDSNNINNNIINSNNNNINNIDNKSIKTQKSNAAAIITKNTPHNITTNPSNTPTNLSFYEKMQKLPQFNPDLSPRTPLPKSPRDIVNSYRKKRKNHIIFIGGELGVSEAWWLSGGKRRVMVRW